MGRLIEKCCLPQYFKLCRHSGDEGDGNRSICKLMEDVQVRLTCHGQTVMAR